MNTRSTEDEDTESQQMNQTADGQTAKKDCDVTVTMSSPPDPSGSEGYVFNGSLKEAERYFMFFWEKEDVFSQWHKSYFVIDGQKYCCAEQYMMYMKAVLLHDDKLARKILKCTDPRRIKSLGRQTEQFSEDLWVHNCLHVIKSGNTAKFLQNDTLKEMLFSTYPRVLVEASPFDKVWGIGFRKYEPCAWNEATWDGKNLLGFILTEVRDELMCKEGIIKESDKKVYFEKLSDDLKNNSFGRKHDRSGRRNFTEGNSHRFQQPDKEITQRQNSEGADIAGTSSHLKATSEQSLESTADEYIAGEDANVTRPNEVAPPIETRKIYEAYQSVAGPEMESESACGITTFDKVPAEQGPLVSELLQGEKEGRDMINKNERLRPSNKSGTSSYENCQESVNPQARLYKPEYRASIEEKRVSMDE